MQHFIMLQKIILASILLCFGDCRKVCNNFDLISSITGHLFGENNVRFVIKPSQHKCIVRPNKKTIGRIEIKTTFTETSDESLVFIGNYSGNQICSLTSHMSKYFNGLVFEDVHAEEIKLCPFTISSRLYILEFDFDQVLLKEVYKITAEQKLIENNLVSYSKLQGIVQHSKQNIWERRKDLSGMSFSACSAVWHP